MDQMTKHTVQCDRVLRHQYHIHRSRIAGARSVPLHRNNSIHDIQPWFHILVQIHQHSGETVRARIQSMPLRLVKSIDESITVLDRPCDTFQCMRLHLAQRDHAVPLQKFRRKDKLFRLDPIRILHMDPLGIVDRRNIKFIKIGIHTCSVNDFRCCSIAARICQNNILIPLLPHQPRKHANYHRMCDNSFINFCFLEKVRFQKNRFFFADNRFETAQKFKAGLQILINKFFPVRITGKKDHFAFFIHNHPR